jgi:hypothetical protein
MKLYLREIRHERITSFETPLTKAAFQLKQLWKLSWITAHIPHFKNTSRYLD